jgi:hypothetical protein
LRWQANYSHNSSANYGSTLAQSPGVLTSPAGQKTERWVFVPTAEPGLNRTGSYYGGSWSNFVVTVDGTAIAEKRLQFNTPGRGSNQMVPWAISAALESSVRSHLVGLKTTVPTPYLRGRPAGTPAMTTRPLITGAPNIFVFDPSHPLGDWRIWSPFARVILRGDEYATLPPANRAALRSWVALGGWLYVAPEVALPGSTQRFGAGLIVNLAKPISADDSHSSEGLFTSEGIFASTPAVPGDLSLEKGGLSNKIPPAKIVGDWLVYFFIGFAALVAPINLFAIAPVRRRHWLFFSVPLISVAAVAILGTAIFLQDGVGGEGARRSLVILLPGENQAAVFQEQVTRTGLLLGSSFPLPDDTICASVPADSGNAQSARSLSFNRADGRASGDWFRSRARQGQHLRRLTPTRARVEQVGQAPDGAPIVQSSVGATLRDFQYLDADESIWWTASLPPGTRVTLTRKSDPEEFARQATELATVVSIQLQEIIKAGMGGTPPGGASWSPAREMVWTPGRFVGRAADSDLAPLPTLPSIRWTDSAVLFTGVVELTGAAAKATP